MIKVIAEAGKNFITDSDISVMEALENAKKLASVAKEAGADYVKYQCHVAEDEVSKRDVGRYEWISLNERLTPLEAFWEPLKEYCDELGIEFLCTPMSAKAAAKIGHLVKRWKVASPDVLDYQLLTALKETGKPVILSSGMTEKEDQEKAVQFLQDVCDVKILHCISEYPCALEHLNLWEVPDYDGLSDHSLSLISGALAVIKGAVIIEKHFTIDSWGKDAHISLNPIQLKEYIRNIRDAEKTLIKNDRPTESEKELLKQFYIS